MLVLYSVVLLYFRASPEFILLTTQVFLVGTQLYISHTTEIINRDNIGHFGVQKPLPHAYPSHLSSLHIALVTQEGIHEHFLDLMVKESLTH